MQQELDRKEALYQAQAISLETIESLRHKTEAAQARLAAAEASRIEAENTLKNAKVKQSLINQGPLAQSNYDAATIKAPVAGTVVKIITR